MEKQIAANDNFTGFYVYVWKRPDGQPFYVGKGKNRRAYDIYDRSEDFLAIHREGGCTVEIVDWFIHESQALAYEIELIALYGRRQMGGLLVNRTDGGDGSVGHVKSPEAIEKWRSKNVGRKNSAEVRAKMSAAKMGHSVSDYARAKMSAAGKKRFEDPAERSKVSARMRNISDETRLRMSEAQKSRLSDPAERARLASISGNPHTEEAKAKISAALTGVAKTADTVANMRASSRMKPPHGACPYKGVSEDRGRYRAIISVDGKTKHLGTHATPEAAAMAYDRAAIAAWGLGNCYINLPQADNDNVQLSLFSSDVA